jgi:hypothetical protein
LKSEKYHLYSALVTGDRDASKLPHVGQLSTLSFFFLSFFLEGMQLSIQSTVATKIMVLVAQLISIKHQDTVRTNRVITDSPPSQK